MVIVDVELDNIVEKVVKLIIEKRVALKDVSFRKYEPFDSMKKYPNQIYIPPFVNLAIEEVIQEKQLIDDSQIRARVKGRFIDWIEDDELYEYIQNLIDLYRI